MGKNTDKAGVILEPGIKRKRFNIFIDKEGRIHLPLDFPDKKDFIDAITVSEISEKIKKSGGLCG